MATIYKQFRGVNEIYGGKIAERFSFSKRFDEPTYFSFKLVFGDTIDQTYNKADMKSNYDVMPQPLFNRLYEKDRDIPVQELRSYSSIRYLVDANEPTRSVMLQEFVEKFDYLQNNFPYYFQQIDGVSELLKIDPTKGQRITEDKKLTITCLEGLDLRMSYLLNLYRKVVWDDVYQRWVLPDMMRYFTLKIYLSEFRVFHLPEVNDQSFPYGSNTVNLSGDSRTILSVLDNILPTWEITCEMCEFDITDINFEHLTGLNVAGEPVQGAVKFGIKVGNIKELQTYPVFENMFLSDRKLNAINRSKDEISTRSDSNNRYLYPASLQIAQNRLGGEPGSHESGRPFNERTNENTTSDAQKSYPSKPATTLSQATNLENKQDQGETWVGNALDFGAAYLKNTVEKVVDKAKTTPIPNLGFSFTELQGAVQSKNIVDVLGLIRKSIATVTNEYVMPSEKLSDKITDGSFQQALIQLSKSQATDPESKLLAEAANVVLSDRGIWEKLKDYSLATDLTAYDETNIKKSLSGTDQYSEIADIKAGIKLSNLQDSGSLQKVDSNAASRLKLEQEILQKISASASLGEKTQDGNLSQISPSSKLSEGVEGGISQQPTSSGLSSDIQGQVRVEEPNKRTTNIQITPGITQSTPAVKTTIIEDSNIIEAVPSSALKSKIESESLPLPNLSRATNNKLE